MKSLLFVFSLVSCYSCHEARSSATPLLYTPVNRTPSDQLYRLFTLDDAQRILGEQAHLKDSSTTPGSVFAYRCAYVANNEDKTTGKTGIIYFMFEEYPDENSAHNSYTSIKHANQDHGIQTIDGVGDEAYFHSDNKNFRFALIRSGKKMVRLKVNKTTANTSNTEFNNVVREIAHRL